jgi:molybdopterin converting factor small subunit
MASLHVPDDLDRLQVVNGHDAAPEHILKDGDVLSAFPPLAGGA